MKLRRHALSTALGLSLLISTTTLQAGVPVIDLKANQQLITNQLENVVQWGKEAAQWAKDNSHYVSELKAYQQQLEDLRSGNYMGLLQSFAGTYFTQGGAMSGMIFGQYADNEAEQLATQYLGKNDSCIPVDGDNNGSNYKACRAARAMKAKALKDMQTMLSEAQNRTTEIQKLVAKSKASNITPGQLQQMAIEMMGMQALLQNDLAKLQLTIEMYKQREKLYEQEQEDSAVAFLNGDGKTSVSVESAFSGILN